MAVSGPGIAPYGGHGGRVYAVAYAPDGATLATGGRDGTIRIWDTGTGKQQRQLSGHTGTVYAVAYAPDGTTLATGGRDGTIRIWDTGTGKQQRQLSGHTRTVYAVAYAPDGTTLATAGDDGTIRIWDTGTGKQQRQLSGHTGPMGSVAYAPDGTTLATGGRDGTIRIWDTGTGKQQRQLSGHTGPVQSVAYAPDGATLATGGDDGTIRIWDTGTGEQQRQLSGHTGPVGSVAYAPDGATLATGGDDGTIRIWDTGTGEQQRQLSGPTGTVYAVAYAPDGTTLATGGGDGTARIWDTGTGEQQRQLSGHAGTVYAVAYAPDGASLATGGDDGTARIWDIRTGKQQRQLSGHTGPVGSVAYAPDGATLATGGDDGTARIWDTGTGEQQRQLSGHAGTVYAVAYAPDGASLATGGEDGTARIWDTGTGEQQRQLSGHTGPVGSVAYAPDGATLATGGDDGTARIWDTGTGEQQRQLSGHAGTVYAVAYAPDGASLATAGRDGTIRIWDTGTGEQQRQLSGHTGPVGSVAYAPDGATLATGGGDGTVRIWDTGTGEQQRQLSGHTAPVQSVAYAPDGATLASVGDMTIRIWNPRNGAQVDGTGFGVTRRIGRPLAGVSSDAPSERDLIAAASDVETLADLIAAAATSPPLAIALIGDWGVGKSSVMLQIQRRIDTLAEMSRNNPGLSVFASNVRQVRFNAWDYSDDQLWSGLVDHLFRTLAADPDSSSAPPDPGTVEAERRALRRNLAEQEAAGERLSSGLRAADRAVQPQGFLAWLGSPVYAWRVVTAAIRELAREIRSAPWVLLGWAVLGAIAYGAWSLWGSKIGATATAVAAVVAPAVVIGQRLRSWHRTGTGATARLRQRLDQQERAINQKIADLRERLALIDASARLSAFLSDRAAPSAYQEYRGLLGQVRSDLATLSNDLTAARNEWLISGATTPPPLERIVLYIDDLDRCPPRRVVEVLEAVHLMLALELFVVVVAVDARWLIRSLEYHYRELFSTGDGLVPSASVSSPEADAEAGPASPVDYLDKIFQIPYVLAPPPPNAMASYLRSLLPPASSPTATPQASPMVPAVESMSVEPGPDSHEGESPTAMGTQDYSPHDGAVAVQLPPGESDDDPRQRAGKTGDQAVKGQPTTPRTEERDTAIPDLRPLGLQVSQPEAEFMTLLGPLLPTPRAAKKLVNLYRLVRIGIPDSGLAAFTGSEAGGQYQVVQILLAVLVGSPAAAQRMFRELMDATPESDIFTVLAKAGAADLPESHLCVRISADLVKISEDTPLMTATSEYQRWCPALARYSFHTRTMTAKPPSIDAPAP